MRSGIRSIIRLLLLLLIFAAILPFTLPLKGGRPLLSLSALKLPTLPSLAGATLPEFSRDGEEGEPRRAGEAVQIYRWRGEEGSWQFSNVAPPAGVHYESVALQPDANLIQGVAPASEPEPAATGGEAAPAASPLPLTLSPKQIGELFDNAQKVRQLMDERTAQQQEAAR